MRASYPVGVDRIRVLWHGHVVKDFDEPLVHPHVLRGHSPWFRATRIPYGRQTLEFEATDHLLNVSEVRISIVHVRGAHRRDRTAVLPRPAGP